MDVNLISYNHEEEEEDYIDMEVSSFSTFLSNSITSSSNPNEFEFHMSSAPLQRNSTSSPADELFYKGKLLPLHTLQNPNSTLDPRESSSEDFYSTPLATTTTPTPFQSCNASPNKSCELNPEEYFLQYKSTELGAQNPKRPWTRKLNVIKKLKASRAYLRSFFSAKSSRSDESCGKASKKNVFQRSSTVMRSFEDQKIIEEDCEGAHRRSFSMSIRRCSAKSSASSSSDGSASSSSSSNSQYLKRSNSVKPEMESPIQGAIAHCKQSQERFRSRKTMSEVGFYSLSTARISVCDDQERSDLSKG